MERKDNNSKTIALIALCIAVMGISLGYAALQTELTINGTAIVESSSWKVEFANLGQVQKTGNTVVDTAPTLTTTRFGDFVVSMRTPGDSITYTFDVKNSGSYDAKITSVTIPVPQCEGTGDQAVTDATNVCNNISYTLKYGAGDTEAGNAVEIGDTLAKSSSRPLVLTLTYSSSVTENLLPKGRVNITNLTIPIIYGQA